MSAILPRSLAVVSPTVAPRLAMAQEAGHSFRSEAAFLAWEKEEATWQAECSAERGRIEAASQARLWAPGGELFEADRRRAELSFYGNGHLYR